MWNAWILSAVVASAFLVSSCKRGSPTVPPGWDLSGKIVFNSISGSGENRGIFIIDLNSPALPVTTLVSSGIEPRVNSNGTELVYTGWQTAMMDIFRMNISGGAPINLTPNPTFSDSWPDWSPDGSSIVFNRVYYPSVKEALCLMNKEGGDLHVLTDTASLAVAVMPRWSPDGNSIAFLGETSFDPPSPYSLYTIAPDGSNQVLLDQVGPVFVDVLPRWSPDSRKIAYGKTHLYSITDTAGGIFVVDVATKAILRININGAGVAEYGYSWLPDGRLVCVAMNAADSTYGLYLVSIAPMISSELLATGFSTIPTTVPSPDGKFISIFGQRNNDPALTLYVVDSDGADLRKLKELGITGHITDYCYCQWIR